MKFTDHLMITDALESRSRFGQLDDHLLADIGLTRAQLKKQNSWFRRKAK